MDSSKLAVKIYLAAGTPMPPASKITPIFQAWIQSHELPDHNLIDVADYAHVPEGPGILLVSDEANIYLDELDGKPGVTYSRKRPISGSLTDRIRTAFAFAIRTAAMLESAADLAGALKFDLTKWSFKINDRLAAPNEDATYQSIEGELRMVLREMFADAPTALLYVPDKLRLFEVTISTSAMIDLQSMLAKLDHVASTIVSTRPTADEA